MTKIQVKLGVAVVAVALCFVASSLTAGIARAGEPVRYPQPSEWDALMEYLEAIAANEANQPATDVPVPPAAPVEPPAAPEAPPAAVVEAPAASPAQSAATAADRGAAAAALPDTGARDTVSRSKLALATALAILGATAIAAGAAAPTRM